VIDTDDQTNAFLNSLFNAGLVIGSMLRHGMNPEPILDTKGNYTNRISIPIFENDEGVRELRVIVVVEGALGAQPDQPTALIPKPR
jgi:hypothetical protein